MSWNGRLDWLSRESSILPRLLHVTFISLGQNPSPDISGWPIPRREPLSKSCYTAPSLVICVTHFLYPLPSTCSLLLPTSSVLHRIFCHSFRFSRRTKIPLILYHYNRNLYHGENDVRERTPGTGRMRDIMLQISPYYGKDPILYKRSKEFFNKAHELIQIEVDNFMVRIG